MRTRILMLLTMLGAVVLGQDEGGSKGGRESGQGPNAVIFVRWRRSVESYAIWERAWQALEPHFGSVTRRDRLVDFGGDEARARSYFESNGDAAMVVAFDPRSAAVASEVMGERPVILVGPEAQALIRARVDREELVRLMRRFLPGTRTVAVLGEPEQLPGLDTIACSSIEQAKGADLAWIPEDSELDGSAARKRLDAWGIPLVVTRPDPSPEDASLIVRPDPRGLGMKLAASILGHLRDDLPLQPASVLRHYVKVDLIASARAGHPVPLAMLARADDVRRAP